MVKIDHENLKFDKFKYIPCDCQFKTYKHFQNEH